MNTYGHLAMEHWRRWLPNRFEQILDPQDFFTRLGDQVSDQVQTTWDALQGTQPPTLREQTEYLANVGRLNALRQMAEERVLADLVFLPPEPLTLEESPLEREPANRADRMPHPLMDETGMPRDRDHPLWAMAEDDSISLTQFQEAAHAWEKSLADPTQAPTSRDAPTAN